MLTFELSWVAFFYVVPGLAIIIGLWVYYDFRDFNRYEPMRSKASFHCIKCGHLYVDKGDKKVSTCPSCGYGNGPLRF